MKPNGLLCADVPLRDNALCC